MINYDFLGNPLAAPTFSDAKGKGRSMPKPNAAAQAFKQSNKPQKPVAPKKGAPALKGSMKKGGAPKVVEDADLEDKIGPIKKGALHKQMGVPQGKKMPKGRMNKMASKLHKKVAKGGKLSAQQLKTSRRLAFAKAARGWRH